MKNRILIIDDEPNIIRTFKSLLEDEGYKASSAGSVEEAEKLVSKNDYDLILLDLNLPGKSGLDFLKEHHDQLGTTSVLVISGQSDISVALSAIKLGAVDYLEKPVSPEKLLTAVNSSMLLVNSNRQRSIMADQLDSGSRFIGESKSFKNMLRTLDQVAPTDTTVLITGENGTGKELAATRIYLNSQRRNSPFIKVNCPGIPETLFESELFGHIKGSFTGAVKDYPGKFVLADKGTLFLDEIGDLPLDCQAKLLRVLENGEVETIGAVEPRQVDVRLICATNRDLPKLIKEGKFREDLYYRISVFNVVLPRLNDRRDDIPLLIGEFMKRYDPANRTKLAPELIAYLTTIDFPGNIRQLKNMIERLSILYPGKTVFPEDIQTDLGPGGASKPVSSEPVSLADKVAEYEKELIRSVMSEVDGNISEAARRLKIERSNLSRKIKDYNLK